MPVDTDHTIGSFVGLMDFYYHSYKCRPLRVDMYVQYVWKTTITKVQAQHN